MERFPPLAAYSHSASVGSLNFLPVRRLSFTINSWQSYHDTLITGFSGSSALFIYGSLPITASHWPAVTSVWPISNPDNVTLCTGDSSRPAILPCSGVAPISNAPPFTPIILNCTPAASITSDAELCSLSATLVTTAARISSGTAVPVFTTTLKLKPGFFTYPPSGTLDL